MSQLKRKYFTTIVQYFIIIEQRKFCISDNVAIPFVSLQKSESCLLKRNFVKYNKWKRILVNCFFLQTAKAEPPVASKTIDSPCLLGHTVRLYTLLFFVTTPFIYLGYLLISVCTLLYLSTKILLTEEAEILKPGSFDRKTF